MPEGRESPKPEDQSDRQVGQTSHGQGTDDASNKGKVNEEQLKVSRESRTLGMHPC
jgi:hypothetical protein